MSVFKRPGLTPVSTVVLLAVLWTVSVRGQSVSSVRANSFEIGPFIGASHGLDSWRVMGGGNVTYAINKYVLPYVEYSYFPGIPKQSSAGDSTFRYTVPISDIHGGVHIRLPFFREKPLVPYGVFGVGGLLTGTFDGTKTFPDPVNPSARITQSVTAPSTSAFAVNGGGGLRYYLGQRYGIRVEAKVYKGFGNLNQTFTKVEFGFFFQLR